MAEDLEDPKKILTRLRKMAEKFAPRRRTGARAFWTKELEGKRKEVLEMRNKGEEGYREGRREFKRMIRKEKEKARGRALEEEEDEMRTQGFQQMAEEAYSVIFEGAVLSQSEEVDYRTQRFPEPISKQEIVEAIKNSPPKVMPGPDGITLKLVRTVNKVRPVTLRICLDQVIREGMPDERKRATRVIIPKLKTTQYDVAKAWRPTQLQSILAKVLERIVVAQITRGYYPSERADKERSTGEDKAVNGAGETLQRPRWNMEGVPMWNTTDNSQTPPTRMPVDRKVRRAGSQEEQHRKTEGLDQSITGGSGNHLEKGRKQSGRRGGGRRKPDSTDTSTGAGGVKM
ncbi:hypothetical protein HOY80DRAFT_1054643 [Tuber brumale]|nr:hypothetical protein HOY80DRAFT_1054643 [Tuber brumale]